MVQMFLKKDKIQRLVGHRPNKKDISNIIQENRQKRELTLYNLMLNSGKKNCALREKKKYSNSRVVRNKISERIKKP
jgi:hypothetical protein